MASSSSRPNWQRNPLFQFFASLKLAVVLLSVLILGAIVGTVCESTFDAKVARAYIYGAAWFNLWLVLLAANLAVSALSRWAWKKHHTAFLVTHLGIITLLAGSLIGRLWGIEGTITLFKGEPPTNRLLVDEHQLRVRDSNGLVRGYPAEFLHRPPSAEHPRELGLLRNGARLAIVDYAPAVEGKLKPRPASEGGAPALHFTIKTALMNQQLESWLLADNPQHGTFSMGLANIELKRGRAPQPQAATPAPAAPVDLAESIFAFSKAPDQQVGRAWQGGKTGARVRLLPPQAGDQGRISISLGQRESNFAVAGNLNKDIPLPGTDFVFKIDNYWPDFRLQDGKPVSLGEQPNNPAVLVTIRGRGVPVAGGAPETDPHASASSINASGGPPAMPAEGAAAPNRLTIYVAENGALSYELVARKNGNSSGPLELNTPLTTGWADWQLVVDQQMPQADEWMDFAPATKANGAAPSAPSLPDGLRVRLVQNGQSFEQWVPAGWQITVPTTPMPTQLSYGWKIVSLPVGIELLDFEVQRNEGSDSPAGFKSTVRVSTAEGDGAIGQCWMNHPFSYPGNWWNTWSGQTFKISQASWNPENLSQSTVQILRDPGWLFKWIGSLLIVSGVFMMFYLRPYRRQTAGEPIVAPEPAGQARPVTDQAPAVETIAR